jgi:uncharacterized protein (DUF1015 family)
MPRIEPIPAVSFAGPVSGDLSALIAPPYDVLDEKGKAALLARDGHNIVAVDLPHLPAKTVGPDATYESAGALYRKWISEGVLKKSDKPAVFVYQQTYTANGRTFKRRGLIANVAVKAFGKASDGLGGIHPHEQTFSGPKEDRMKLMKATKAQLSPIFGLYSDPKNQVGPVLEKVISSGKPTVFATSPGDKVLHEMWRVEDAATIGALTGSVQGRELFIADGHHRYTTALNYKNGLEQAGGALPAGHPANNCLFVLISLQDAGMIILPTHRVLGGMGKYSFEAFKKASAPYLKIVPFGGKSLEELEAALPKAGPHAIGLYDPRNPSQTMSIATTLEADPLKESHAKMSQAWRQLDVAIVQHIYVEKVCQGQLCEAGQTVAWKFPHTAEEFDRDTKAEGYQLGLMVQATPLESVRLVSEAGELMPQKSTFFYPKLATGLVINPLEV